MYMENLYKKVTKFEKNIWAKIAKSIHVVDDGTSQNKFKIWDSHIDYMKDKKILILINRRYYNQMLKQVKKDDMNDEIWYYCDLFTFPKYKIIVSNKKFKNSKIRLGNVVCKLKRKQSGQAIC